MTFFVVYTKYHLQDFVPMPSQLWPAADCLVPDDGEVGHAAEVLCDGHCVVHVEDNVPPATGNKHCLPWALEDLQLHNKLNIGRKHMQVFFQLRIVSYNGQKVHFYIIKDK